VRNAIRPSSESDVKIKAVVHEAEVGGFWAEVPAIPGCATQGETMEELLQSP
jgi:predicted RNase H-like HicB family nuclease